tara:strand:- start:253 stop:546 length:294 start_codon:yes stop_codon:yes gene_type:complete
MSMPKGHKSKHGYATISSVEGGMDYRTIAETMTKDGHKMNHATARNVFLKAMKKIAAPVHDLFDMSMDDDDLIRTAKDPRFQESIIEIIEDHSDIKL